MTAPPSRPDRAAEDLAAQAYSLLAPIFTGAEWPTASVVHRFLSDGTLGQALSLLLRAMSLDPAEPSYPWNAGTAMWRLGQAEIAVGLFARAHTVVDKRGLNGEWDGVGMRLAIANAANAAELNELAALEVIAALAAVNGAADPEIELLAADLEEEVWALRSAFEAHLPSLAIAASKQRTIDDDEMPMGPAMRIVRPRGRAWVVANQHGKRNTSIHASKDEAISRARQIVANSGGGAIVVEATGGKRERISVPPRQRL